MRLVDDESGCRGWEVDGDSTSGKSLCGRFLIRDDEVRDDAGVGDEVVEDGSGATCGSIVADTKNEAGDVIEES